MTTAHLTRTIQDKKTGRVVLGATVTLCNPNTTTPITQSVFADAILSQELPNPFVCVDGKIDVYVDDPITVQLVIQLGTSIDYINNLAVLPFAENFLVSASPLRFMNAPGTNTYLRGVDSSNLEWGELSDTFVPSDAAVMGWFVTSSFQLDQIVRDANGAMLTAVVTWPDSISGEYTADLVSTIFPGRVDAWHVTRDLSSGTVTYTQQEVTRDADGAIIDIPLVEVS